jgi:hypothetical protein
MLVTPIDPSMLVKAFKVASANIAGSVLASSPSA